MTSYFLAGQEANGCTQAWSVASTSADALFPLANLTTGKPFEIFKFSAAAADVTITYDMNIVVDASFEVGTVANPPPSPWMVSAGTPTVQTQGAEADGTQSLRVNAALEAAYQDIILLQGKRYRFEINLFGDGTNNIEVYFIDLNTGKYKTSSSETSWTATSTALFTRSTGSWATSTQTLIMDSPIDGDSGKSGVRILIKKAAGSGSAYADLAIVYPDVDFAAMIDYNYPDANACEIHSSTDNFSGSDTTEDTLPAGRFRSYIFFTPVSSTPRRWWRFKFTGTTIETIFVGQPVLGEITTWLSPRYGSNISYTMPQGGIDTKSLRLPVSLNRDGRLEIDMDFVHTSTEYEQALEELIKTSSFGAEPVIFVPDSTRHEIIHGRVSNSNSVSIVANNIYSHGIIIVEDPFAVQTK